MLLNEIYLFIYLKKIITNYLITSTHIYIYVSTLIIINIVYKQ